MHIAEVGEGPTVIFLHGFPELWYSWRHQLAALDAAGYHAVAPDQRGYGTSSVPGEVTDYDIAHLTRDVIELIDDLGTRRVTLVGHDFGALVGWATALEYPDRIAGIAGLSVPYVPRTPVRPTEYFCDLMGEDFYMLWLQQPGVADSAFAADIERALAGQWVSDRHRWQSGPPPARFPWRDAEDQQIYIDALQRNGFTGPLNWYRNFDRNWEILAPLEGATIDCPAMFVAGGDDPVLQFMPPSMMDGYVTNLRVSAILPGFGHWIQEEAPSLVNQYLLDFLQHVHAENTTNRG
ncbi:hypothetical protein BST10_21005 [Mycolicibacter algericus DSM 45454]|uniref:AB hydrolase-1 domain-containing protein n=2 Tax=Mycolicibacter algericus TaxID=1288388 RepID=A0ABX3RES4_MYCAL|nr:hypothetical protein BST10_21005 [Mycolicibacter algericus DSM 45454]